MSVRPLDYTAGHGMIQTATGLYVSPLELDVDDIDIRDIAHALSHQCRFAGHTSTFYSVAEHSVRVCRRVAELGGDTQDRLWGLLHDASEAYLVDLPRPLKQLTEFGEGYRTAEGRVLWEICRRFDLDPVEPDVVVQADRELVLMERRDLMPDGERWTKPGLPADTIWPWSSLEARRIFLKAFEILNR